MLRFYRTDLCTGRNVYKRSKKYVPRPGSSTAGRSVPWLNPHRGLEGAPPPDTWRSPRSSPATGAVGNIKWNAVQIWYLPCGGSLASHSCFLYQSTEKFRDLRGGYAWPSTWYLPCGGSFASHSCFQYQSTEKFRDLSQHTATSILFMGNIANVNGTA